MSDDKDPPETPPSDTPPERPVFDGPSISVEQEMKTSFLDYSMSVIVSRAIPDLRDGLKPVHRRILFGMSEGGYDYNKPYKKSARLVGDVMGKYHPHGDTAIYDAMVRMAQDFSMSLMLADGQGNFGSMDGDNPAAMRYTEVRMAKVAEELLKDLDKEHRRFPAELFERIPRADCPARAVPEPAGQRLARDRGRHGDEHPAAQSWAR